MTPARTGAPSHRIETTSGSGFVARVLHALTTDVAVLIGFGGLIASIGGAVAAPVAVLVGFRGFSGDVVVVDVAHGRYLPPFPLLETLGGRSVGR